MASSITQLKRGVYANGYTVNLHGIGKQYGERGVLKGIDLKIPAGEFVAFVGRSGCGKSTLLRLIAGLEKPTTGSLLIANHGRRKYDTHTRIMFQDPRLLPWRKIIQNVGLGLKGKWQRNALHALSEVGLDDRANEWPSILSGGQKQRVALARALIHEPKLLLLDEPLGALDALTRIDMQSLIENIWRDIGFTALLVTHDVAEAVALADRVILIEDGQIALDLKINLPRPRARDNPAFVALEKQILSRVLKQQDTHQISEPFIPAYETNVRLLRWAN
jgi:sulfonate transport system ATP-binding protein